MYVGIHSLLPSSDGRHPGCDLELVLTALNLLYHLKQNNISSQTP